MRTETSRDESQGTPTGALAKVDESR